MGYWDETANIQRRLGSRKPRCPTCGEEMFPQDDHGRFTCFCELMKPISHLDPHVAAIARALEETPASPGVADYVKAGANQDPDACAEALRKIDEE